MKRKTYLLKRNFLQRNCAFQRKAHIFETNLHFNFNCLRAMLRPLHIRGKVLAPAPLHCAWKNHALITRMGDEFQTN